jgi:AhpD family alkylhydroperoxidase
LIGLRITKGIALDVYHDLITSLKQPTRDFRDSIAKTWQGFSDLHRSAVEDGVLPGKIKELIALAIATADGCEGCIGYHARAAAMKGATEEETAEALGVALLMAGGPASVYGPRALEAFREFADERSRRESAAATAS